MRLPAVKPEKEQFQVSIKFKMHEDKVIRFEESTLVEEWTEEEKVRPEKQEAKKDGK